MKVLLVLLVLVCGFGFVGVNMYISAHDQEVQYLSDIKGLNEGSRSELSSYTLKIQDMAQIPKMYSADLTKLVETFFTSRKGESNQAVMAFMQQNVPNLDPKMYERIMIAMESGRDAFNNIQKRKVDVCQSYEAFRKKFVNSTILGEFKPTDEYTKMCRVVSDSRTNEAFETGEQTSLKL